MKHRRLYSVTNDDLFGNGKGGLLFFSAKKTAQRFIDERPERPGNKLLNKGQTIKYLENICGSLSAPSKMPCSGYSIPAIHCIVGSLLRNTPDNIETVCDDCYALKGRYIFGTVKEAMDKRHKSLTDVRWVWAVTNLIRFGRKGDQKFFRWHDSGDIQGPEHFTNICRVAQNLPEIQFWLPTRETGRIRRTIESDDFLYEFDSGIPFNLHVRFSAHRVNDLGSSLNSIESYMPSRDKGNMSLSVVVTDIDNARKIESAYGRKVKICPATLPESNHKCNDCRACWRSPDVVAYMKH